MILDHPNCFGRVQIVFIGSKSFWLGPNRFGWVQITFGQVFLDYVLEFGHVQNDLDPTKTNWARSKRFGRSKLILDP